MKNHTVTWLHLSDLHICQPKTGWDAARVLEKLRDDLLHMQQAHGLQPDLIFFTGDAAFGHLGKDEGYAIKDQFDEAGLLFDEIRQCFEPAVPQENIFIVPGNHDVNRSPIVPSQTEYLHGLLKKGWGEAKDTITAMIQDTNVEWQNCMQRLDDYRDFLKTWGYTHLLDDPDRLIYSTVREVGPIKLGIAGLNSAWSCSGDQERGKLWLAGNWQIETLRQPIKDADLRMGLIHHPLGWFTEVEDPTLAPRVESEFHFWLHGHEHQDWVYRHDEHLRIAGGAAYDRADAKNGYNWVRLNFKTGQAEVWLRKYSNEGRGGWIPNVIPGKTDNEGRWGFDDLKFMQEFMPKLAQPKPPPDVQPDQIPDREEPEEEPLLAGPESRGIFGRTNKIAWITELLTKKPLITIYGMSGIGKTELIKEIRQMPIYQAYKYLPIQVDSGLKLTDLYQMVQPILGWQNPVPMPWGADLARPDFSFLSQCQPQPVIIHFEQAEFFYQQGNFQRSEIRKFLETLVQQHPAIRIIFESRVRLSKYTFPNELYQVTMLPGLKEDAVQAYFRRPFINQPTKGFELSQEETAEIYGRLGGNEEVGRAHPLAMFLLATVADGLQQKPNKILQDSPQMLFRQLEQKLFSELYNHVLDGPARYMLWLCSLYRNGIPDDHAQPLEERAEQIGAFDRLVDRCLLNASEQAEWYTLHSLISELTQKRGADEFSDFMLEDHEAIGHLWRAKIQGVRRISLPAIRSATEAAHHYLQAEAYTELQAFQADFLRGDILSSLEQASFKLSRAKRHAENKHILELLVILDQHNPKHHSFLGETLEKLEGRGGERAFQHYKQAYDLSPAFPKNLANLGRCCLARQMPQYYITIVENLPRQTYERVMNEYNLAIYANCLTEVGRGEAASQLRQAEIAQGSQDPAFYADEARYLGAQGDVAGALALLDQAEALGIGNPFTHSIRATLLEDDGQGEAASQLRQAEIAQGSQNPVFYADEARYLSDQGDVAGALALLDQAEALGIGDEYTHSIRSRMERNYHEFG